MIISRSPARYGFLIATIKLLSIATFGKTSKIHTSAGGNINTPHGGKTADAAESETRRWTGQLAHCKAVPAPEIKTKSAKVATK
jgi:hypothetical protein